MITKVLFIVSILSPLGFREVFSSNGPNLSSSDQHKVASWRDMRPPLEHCLESPMPACKGYCITNYNPHIPKYPFCKELLEGGRRRMVQPEVCPDPEKWYIYPGCAQPDQVCSIDPWHPSCPKYREKHNEK